MNEKYYPAENLYKDMKGSFAYVAMMTAVRTRGALTHPECLETISKEEKKIYLYELFRNVKYVLQSEACLDRGNVAGDGLDSMAIILTQMPEEKDKLIPQMLPLVERYTKFPKGDAPFQVGMDIQANGLLKIATAIATTDTKYAPEMLKIFENKEVQDKMDDFGYFGAFQNLKTILKAEPSLAPDIQRISQHYNSECPYMVDGGEAYRDLQNSVNEVMSNAQFRISQARKNINPPEK